MTEQHPERGPDLSPVNEIVILPQIDRYVDEHVAPPLRQHMKEYLMVIFSSTFYRDRILELISKLNISTEHDNADIRYEAQRYQFSMIRILEEVTQSSYQSFPHFIDAFHKLYPSSPEAVEDVPAHMENADCFTRTARPVSEFYREVRIAERQQPDGTKRSFAEVKWNRSDWLNALEGNGEFNAYDLKNFLEIFYASCSGMNDTEYALTMEVPQELSGFSGTYVSGNPVERKFVRDLGFETALEQSSRAVYLGHGFGGEEHVLAEKAYQVAEIVGSLQAAPETTHGFVADTVVLRSTDLGLGGFGQNEARREMLELLSKQYSIEENALKKVIDTTETIPVLRRKKQAIPDYLQAQNELTLEKQIIYEWWSMGGATGAHSVAYMVDIQRQFSQYPTIPMTAILYSPIAHGSTESLASGFVANLLWANNVLGTAPFLRKIATSKLREIPTRYVVRWKMGAKTEEQKWNADQLAGVIARYPRDSYRLVRELSKNGGYAGVPSHLAEIISEGSAHVIVVIGEEDRIVDPTITEEYYRTIGDEVIDRKLQAQSFVIEGHDFGYAGAEQVVQIIDDFYNEHQTDSEVSYLQNFYNFIKANVNRYDPNLVFAIQLSTWRTLQDQQGQALKLPEWFATASSVITDGDTIRQHYKRGPVIGIFPNMPHSTIFDQSDIEQYLLSVIPMTRPSDLRDILGFVENGNYWPAASRLANSIRERYHINPGRISESVYQEAVQFIHASEGFVRMSGNLEQVSRGFLLRFFGPMLNNFRLPK